MDDHKKAFVVVITFLSLFLVYGFLCNHQFSIMNTLWASYFGKYANYVTHDDGMWFYKGISTCVQYNGDFNEKCDKSLGICAGKNEYDDKYGGYIEQSKEVITSIINGGVHPKCPLIYYGTD